MSMNRQEESSKKILSGRYDLRKYFHYIYKIVLSDYFKNELPEECYIHSQIFDQTSLETCFQTQYPNKKICRIILRTST